MAPIPAAQYLRTSRSFQDCYLSRQKEFIAEFAHAHGFSIVRTYSDPGRSGLTLNGRPGLKRLLTDVFQDVPPFAAILVYDVSRWGRFQDADESAHYEFLCKRSGIPVYYCGEPYINGKTIVAGLFKNMRRGQAAEFSRELSEKVLRGSRHIAEKGFRLGGEAGFGFRRMMVSQDGKPLQLLNQGEYKFNKNYRVRLVLGPSEEVKTIKDIFKMAASNRADCASIARSLNHRGIPYLRGRRWDYYDVRRLLTNSKYAGQSVYGRTSQRLKSPKQDVASQHWIVRDGVFSRIVEPVIFDRVQRLLRDRSPRAWTQEELLQRIRVLLKKRGRLTYQIIDQDRRTPSAHLYASHFGSFRKLYALVGYKPGKARFEKRRHATSTEMLRLQLFEQIRDLFRGDISVFHLPNRLRFILRLDNGLSVSVVLCRTARSRTGKAGWKIYPTASERHYITLLCRLNDKNDRILDFHLFPFIEKRWVCVFRESDAWFKRGKPLLDLRDLPSQAKLLSRIDDISK
jgi:DNA invertase Pin-like site-specific DNA recombinase